MRNLVRDARPAPDSAFRIPHSAFQNQPPSRLFVQDERDAFAAALAAVRTEVGREYVLRLGGEDVRTEAVTPVLDPSRPDAPAIGFVHNAGIAQVARALALSTAAADGWAARPVSERTAALRRAAELLAERRNHTAAWIVHEAAKSWPEALADVDEAIDYLRYYADESGVGGGELGVEDNTEETKHHTPKNRNSKNDRRAAAGRRAARGRRAGGRADLAARRR
jgi:delta 1-pyrroline-5-carboxylate dehydrogenase